MTAYPEQWQLPPTPPRSSRARVLIAWLVILATAAGIIVRPRWLLHRQRGDGELPGPASVEQTPSAQLQMLGRFIVGAKAFAPDKPVDPGLASKIDEMVFNPIDDFRAIIVVDELLGDEAALRRLNDFEKKYQVVR